MSANEKAPPPAQDPHEDFDRNSVDDYRVGSTTVDSTLPLLLAAEHLAATTQHVAALHDDLKWCFDSPSRTVVEPESQSRLKRVAQHTIGPLPIHANPSGTHTNVCTDAAPAYADPVADANQSAAAPADASRSVSQRLLDSIDPD